jgi:hypothetical protein
MNDYRFAVKDCPEYNFPLQLGRIAILDVDG